jgi:ABC-type Fe3+/spermidine/putrescine transport system ATPase subunit
MILANNLVKHFDKRGIAGVRGLSFSLEKGKIMAIMGPNGSGKTSLLKILSGSVKAESGTYTIDGQVSFFPSSETPLDLNVQNLLVQSVTLEIEEEKKIQLARDLADTFEFTFQLRQKMSELSSGQKQKILLAKELINRPALLLMDEPFAHLDPYTRRDILKNLFTYIKDQSITVLWVTHDLEEALRFSDVIGLMNFGKFEQLADPITMTKKPKNLFVAKFMGYRNFFVIKYENDSWTTLWNQIPGTPDEAKERILIIPDHAWRIGEGLECKIIERHAGTQTMEYVLQNDNRKIHLILGSQKSLFESGSLIKISPVWEECFQIPL